MNFTRITITNGTIGGLLLITMLLLGDYLKYLVGLGIALVYVTVLVATVINIVGLNPTLEFKKQFLICLSVFLISSLISAVFVFATNRNIGDFSENIEAYFVLFLIGVFLSFVIPSIRRILRVIFKK